MEVTVLIVPKVCPDVRWIKHSISQAATVGTVKEEFCNCYQTPISQCQLCLPGGPSSRQSAVISSDQALREVLGKSKDEITLTAVFQPSIAFHTWHRFDKHTFSLPAGLSAAWKCCVQDVVAEMRGLNPPLSDGGPSFYPVYANIAEAAPTTQLPLGSTREVLQILPHMLNDLLKCARDFSAQGLLEQPPSSWIPPFDSQTAEAATHVSSDANGSQTPQMLDRLALDTSVPYRPGSYHNLLQSVLLLLKLANLTGSIGVQTPNTQAALDMLWNTLRACSNSMSGFASSNSKSNSIAASNMPAEAVDPEPQDIEDGLVTHLVAQLAVEEYCNTITSRPAVADICCKMLTAMLQAAEDCTFVVTREIVCQGVLEALMKAIQTSRATAKPACELLQCLMSSADPYKDNIAKTEAMLAKMQAVHCCVRLLCPPAPATDPEALDITVRCFGVYWVPVEDCTEEHLAFLASVATFLSRIAQHPSDEAGRATSRQDNSTSFCYPPTWAAPSKAEWLTILNTSNLLCVTLVWLLSDIPIKQGENAHMQCRQLEKALWGILHGLLIGHLQNNDLQLQDVGLCMLGAATDAALGRQEMARHQSLRGLLKALLIRLARDPKLTEETRGKSHNGHPQSYYLKPLWRLLGVYATATPKHQSATLDCSNTAFEAFFVFLNSQQNIVSIRHGDHLPLLDLERCMQHLKGQLAAQMNAGACLCKLAFVELQDAADAATGAELSCDYCDILLTQKGFKAIMEAYEAGVQAPLPWSEEQTVALIRLLWQFSFLLKIVRELEHGLARLESTHQHWSPQRRVLQKLSLKLLSLLPKAAMPQVLHRQLLRAVCCSLQVASCTSCTPLDAKGLGSTLTDVMIAATSAFHTDSSTRSTDPDPSYPDVGLPGSTVTSMQAAPLCVIEMLVTEQKHWAEFGSRAFAAGIQTLSHAVCLKLARRDGCKGSAYSSEDTPEMLCLQDSPPYLHMIQDMLQWVQPSDHAMHAAMACSMLQFLCLLVHMAADQQAEMASYHASMLECRDTSKALRQAGVPPQDVRVLQNNVVFLRAKRLFDCKASECDSLFPALEGVLATVRFMQKDATCAQALIQAAKGQWSKDLGNTPETLAAKLSFLGTADTPTSELLKEIQHCFEVSQDNLAKDTRSTVATPATEAAVKVGSPTVAIAASEAAEEATSIPKAETAAKAAAKRAKKKRQKAAKKQQDALTQGVEQLPPQQACSPQYMCSAVSMDVHSTTILVPADAQQVPTDELAAASEAHAATSVCMPAESAGESVAMPSCASNEDAVQSPTLDSETPDTVSHDTCSSQAQQTSLDSAESPLCALEMHRAQAPNTHMSEASAERDADQGVSKACVQELPLCDLKHSLDAAWKPGRGERLPTCDFQLISNLLCCPFTKEPYRDPVIAHDGYTYERTAIEQWLQIKSISPVSGQPLSNMLLTPNRVITAIALDCTAGV